MSKVPISVLNPRFVYGLRTEIKANVHFTTDDEAVYPAGNVLIFHNFNQNRQKLIKLSDKIQPISMIVMSPNKKTVALCEKGDKPQITLYDTSTLKKKKIIGIPALAGVELQAKEFVTAQFSMDSKYLMAVTGEPDWMLFCYNWEKGKLESYCKAQNPNGTGTVVQIACNPTDPTTVGLVGDQLFRLLMLTESVFRQWGFSKADLWNLSCCCWLSQERFLAGTVDGMIHFVESGEYKLSFNALDTITYNFKAKEDSGEKKVAVQGTTSVIIIKSAEAIERQEFKVEHMMSLQKGFYYVCTQGTIHFFERISPFKYTKRNIYKVPPVTFRTGPPFNSMTQIHYVALGVSEDRLLVTTPRTQIFTIRLWGPDMNSNPEIQLVPIGAALHCGTISTVTLCAWRPIFITCGEVDRSLRVWNYETESLLFVKEYHEDIHGVALHPSGLYATVGFSDKLRYMLVRIDDIEAQKEFPIRSCKECQFSSNGHMFAAVNGNVIQIYSTISFDNMYTLKGHNGKIVSLSWSAYDLKLSSCGLEGAIYEWDLTDPEDIKRSSEYITKTISYKDCAITMDGKQTYAIGCDGNLKLISDSVCVKDLTFTSGPLDSLAKARSDLMIFLAGPSGTIYSIKFPIQDVPEYTDFKIHCNNITRMRLSYDDKYLISVASDGMIVIWKLFYTEGKLVKLDKEFSHSDELLISYPDLEDKIRSIKELTTRLHEMHTEHEYQFRTMQATHNEKMTELHANYNKIIDELKEKNEHLETDHLIEINNINIDISRMKNQHEQNMQDQELMYNEKLINEYDKYHQLEDKLASVRKMYDKKLEDLNELKEQTVKDICTDYTKQLADKDVQIEELNEEIKQLIREHELIKQQIEDDADREILELKSAHETILLEEQENNVKLRSETMITKKKYLAAVKEMEELKNSVHTLEDDHSKFKQNIQKLENDIDDLKKEIVERDQSIQDKEKRIHDLKYKNSELEKYRFILDYKIKSLRSQIEPKEFEIQEQKLQIEDMVEELEVLQKKINSLGLYITELRAKLFAADNEYRAEHARLRQCKTLLRHMRIDLHDLTGLIQEPNKLKIALKEMYHRYNDGREFQVSQVEDADARNEFSRQREHLERTVRGLRKAAKRHEPGIQEDKMRVVEQSTELIAEMNIMRRKYKETLRDNVRMESLLGFKSKFITPKEAREKINTAVNTKEDIHNQYKSRILSLEMSVKSLKEENQRLLNKIMENSFLTPLKGETSGNQHDQKKSSQDM